MKLYFQNFNLKPIIKVKATTKVYQVVLKKHKSQNQGTIKVLVTINHPIEIKVSNK